MAMALPRASVNGTNEAVDAPEQPELQESWRNLAAFWVLGFINNVGYVIMIAGAEEISSGGVGLVYFFDIFPSLFTTLTGPYWFHYFSYRSRTIAGAVWMLASFLVVGFGTSSLALQLVGVALSGFQSGMMESSYLAMASFYRSPKRCLTAWSSGTGLAGLGGYLWLRIFNKWGGLSFKTTLGIACIFPVLYVLAFVYILEQKQLPPARKHKNMVLQRAVENIDQAEVAANIVVSRASSIARKSEDNYKQMTEDAVVVEEGKVVGLVDGSTTGFYQKMRFIFTLAPYILPLTVVYFAEYTVQTGVWSSIGFPVSDADARSDFYSSAGLCYQAGVFVSRSSGVLFQATRPVLYLMPFLQCALLAFFVAVGATHFWFDSWLLILCFAVGLLGGAVYVNAYTLVSKEVKPSHVELALCATSVGDTIGIILADIFGLVLQGCMYSLNGLTGATIEVSC